MLLDILLWILFGALAGWIASMIMKTDAQMGALANIAVGIIGAFVGGFLFRMLTGVTVEGFSLTSLIVAIIGAVILLAIVKAVSGRRTTSV
jgi:Predicted membrane protein